MLRSFLERENSLLASSSKAGLQPEAEIDIPHESLIWKWQRLQEWVRKEAVSAEWYLDLVNDTSRFRRGESGLWRGATLARALALRRTEGWNESWAAQYHPSADTSYADALQFLERSRNAQIRERWIWSDRHRRCSSGLCRAQEAEEFRSCRPRSAISRAGRRERPKYPRWPRRRRYSPAPPRPRSEESWKNRSRRRRQANSPEDGRSAEGAAGPGGQSGRQRRRPERASTRFFKTERTNWKPVSRSSNRTSTDERAIHASAQDAYDTAGRETGRLRLQLDQVTRNAMRSKRGR